MDLSVLKERNVRIFTACTGAGAGIQKALWDVPGCSSYFVGGVFPYAGDATAEFLGFTPEKFCSRETAIELAMRAYMRANGHGGPPVGFGLTASVATLREHRGDHRVYVAVMTDEGVFGRSLVLPKGAGLDARLSDANMVDTFGARALLEVCTGDFLRATMDWTERARELFFERPVFAANGTRYSSLEDAGLDRVVFLPGAFNPPHEGHFGAAKVVERRVDSVVFSITADHPVKEPLTLADMLTRARMLEGRQPVMFTQGDALYIDKARRFPKTGFIIGADAVMEMLDPKWGYPQGELLGVFRALGTVFYVVGREVNGKWVSFNEALETIPRMTYGSVFVPVEGRWDVSSSQIRESA